MAPSRNLRSRFAHKGDPYDFGRILRFGGLGPLPSSKIGPWPPPVVESCIRACPTVCRLPSLLAPRLVSLPPLDCVLRLTAAPCRSRPSSCPRPGPGRGCTGDDPPADLAPPPLAAAPPSPAPHPEPDAAPPPTASTAGTPTPTANNTTTTTTHTSPENQARY